MFDKNFNAESSIKKWASGMLIGGKILMWCSVIAAFIVLCCDAEYLWWVSLIILGGGALIMLSTMFSATMIWGFGDVVGNIKKMTEDTTTQTNTIEEDLPEL